MSKMWLCWNLKYSRKNQKNPQSTDAQTSERQNWGIDFGFIYSLRPDSLSLKIRWTVL